MALRAQITYDSDVNDVYLVVWNWKIIIIIIIIIIIKTHTK